MIRIYKSLRELDFGKLMQVYAEGNLENAREFHSDLDMNVGILQAEQDFYAYLKEGFFQTEGVFYAVLEESGQYISAFRMEPYQDGLLLEALETAPEFRRRGYAKRLLSAVLGSVEVPVYSHVNKKNEASLRTHLACGFRRILEQAVMVDGSVVDYCCTLCRNSCMDVKSY